MESLKIIKMGCDFWKDDETVKESDFTNYRYYIHNIQLKDEIKEKYNINKNWNLRTIEIMRSYKQEVKKNKLVVVDKCILGINIYLEDENGNQFGNREFEKDLNKDHLKYTKENLLYIINKISKIQYNTIEELENK